LKGKDFEAVGAAVMEIIIPDNGLRQKYIQGESSLPKIYSRFVDERDLGEMVQRELARLGYKIVRE
jgi:hypothetical protein